MRNPCNNPQPHKIGSLPCCEGIEPHEKVLNSNPWKSIDDSLEALIDKVVLEANPVTLDDDIPNLLADEDNRKMAIDHIMSLLVKKGEYYGD